MKNTKNMDFWLLRMFSFDKNWEETDFNESQMLMLGIIHPK